MVRFLFLAALLLASSLLLLAVAERSHAAAPSKAEEFWSTVLPNYALPDSLFWHLQPGHNSESTAQATSTGDNDGAEQLSRIFPYFTYKSSSHERSAGDGAERHNSESTAQATSTGDNDGAEQLSRIFPYFTYKSSSHECSAGDGAECHNSESTAQATSTGDNDGAERLSRLFPYFTYKSSSYKRSAGDGAERLSRFFLHPSYKSSSHEPVAANEGAERLSRVFPYKYKASSSKLSSDKGHSSRMHMPAGDVSGLLKNNTVFFHEEAVQVGKVLPFYFPAASRAPLGFLPRNVAGSIPFSTSALPGVLARFRIPAGSALAADMEETVGMCEAPPLVGEAKFCATSLEALVEGAMVALGTRDIRPVISTLPRSGAPSQQYTIRSVLPVEGSRFVACHDEDYLYTVYMCHDTGRARLSMVEMEGAGGRVVTVAVICHTDTSKWDPDHISFKFLPGTKPGGAPVCHFMPYGHIMWAKNENHSSA